MAFTRRVGGRQPLIRPETARRDAEEGRSYQGPAKIRFCPFLGFLIACTRHATAQANLQCGHDPKAVENSKIPCAITWGSTGFNAATTRRPWRTRRFPAR